MQHSHAIEEIRVDIVYSCVPTDVSGMNNITVLVLLKTNYYSDCNSQYFLLLTCYQGYQFSTTSTIVQHTNST